MPEEKLEIENLRKTYGEEVAVEGLSLTVEEGEFRSLLGPSGCGKTTTLRCVAGIEKPTSGRIFIDGELVSDPEGNVQKKPEAREIGMVFQSYAIWPHMTVMENVMFPLDVRKIGTKSERREKVRATLEMVGLGKYEHTMATDLSGGQQQRVAISRSLVVEPEILLFDEPLSNLDAKLRREMRKDIKGICNDLEITVLYVTHAQDEAMYLSDSISLMLDGSIKEENSPEALHTSPKTLFAMDFMGHSNHVRGRITGRNDSTITVETSIGTFDLDVADHDLEIATEGVILSFRPKFCSVTRNGSEVRSKNGTTYLEGELLMKSPTRDFTEYEVLINDRTILVRDPEPLPFRPSDPIRFALDSRDIRVFPDDPTGFQPEKLA